MAVYRRETAYQVRVDAATKARERTHPTHEANGDEQRYASANYAMSFTKGLDHDPKHGLIKEREYFEHFRKAIDEGFIDPFTAGIQVSPVKGRGWEAPTAGVVYDLQGPDAQAVTMPPAPPLGSDELAYEMAEVYELALLRDVPLTGFSDATPDGNVQESVDRLNDLAYTKAGFPGRPRTTGADDQVTVQTAFRGSSPKVDVGPYLSQFMLIGNDQPGQTLDEGFIEYGVLRVDQRVPVAIPQNYMITPTTWLEAQNGANLLNPDTLYNPNVNPFRRFITVPRDLATYVHFDALYEAYLNACLILLSMKTPFDPGFENLSGMGFFPGAPAGTGREAGGFALYGGPHILTLVTEVATRALKAVRYQKFNVHARLRPEALAGRIHFAEQIEEDFPHVDGAFSALAESIKDTVDEIKKKNEDDNGGTETAFLPMAFQEGSPMHPAYGAGHATVAGACVTILKAYFDTSAMFLRRTKTSKVQNIAPKVEDLFTHRVDEDANYTYDDYQPVQYLPNADGTQLVSSHPAYCLTLEGELNKLAANISIGRNMAGVHYYTDYYDSLRMGEEIAIGMLQEQALCYPTDPFIMSLPTFDGKVVRIGGR